VAITAMAMSLPLPTAMHLPLPMATATPLPPIPMAMVMGIQVMDMATGQVTEMAIGRRLLTSGIMGIGANCAFHSPTV
jgi:hypothetical protein